MSLPAIETAGAELPTEENKAERLRQIDDLRFFLATAPSKLEKDQVISRYSLPTGDFISCVLYNNLFHVTGTDIVRCLVFRFHAFGRPVTNIKKFEEGIFSDLRNLKPGQDASLEEPKSEFLELLFKNNCIRTQKKQKVFYWFSVPHDRLFLDAMERDLKREKAGGQTTTVAMAEPALSISLDTTKQLFKEFKKTIVGEEIKDAEDEKVASDDEDGQVEIGEDGHDASGMAKDDENEEDGAYLHIHEETQQVEGMYDRENGAEMQVDPTQADLITTGYDTFHSLQQQAIANHYSEHLAALQASGCTSEGRKERPLSGSSKSHHPVLSTISENGDIAQTSSLPNTPAGATTPDAAKATVLGAFPLFVGSPTYKQRRRRASSMSMSAASSRKTDTPATTGQGQADSMSVPSLSTSGVTTEKFKRRFHPGHGRSISHPNLTFMMGEDAHNRSTSPMSTRSGRTVTPRSSLSNLSASAHDYCGEDVKSEDAPILTADTIPIVTSGVTPSERTYACSFPNCSRVFKRLEHLRRHLRTHTLERPYPCPMCNKRFSRSDNLAQHKKTHERKRNSGRVTKADANHTRTSSDGGLAAVVAGLAISRGGHSRNSSRDDYLSASGASSPHESITPMEELEGFSSGEWSHITSAEGQSGDEEAPTVPSQVFPTYLHHMSTNNLSPLYQGMYPFPSYFPPAPQQYLGEMRSPGPYAHQPAPSPNSLLHEEHESTPDHALHTDQPSPQTSHPPIVRSQTLPTDDLMMHHYPVTPQFAYPVQDMHIPYAYPLPQPYFMRPEQQLSFLPKRRYVDKDEYQ
ncbi:hypothetical protein BZG36_05447 [Bifiguratus adelaidae]|uniref:C2H2-type domain-containing protein n=1 Tax=Bifiguratus adelaidae TaxID=1938954 RepID=A0A261XTP3_9FUNG|nr:hypothetical protein BZG36_05447 [Bifiguratus adelaidae]